MSLSYNFLVNLIDFRCLVLWSDTVCDVGGCISIWGSWRSKKLPQDNWCTFLMHNSSIIWRISFLVPTYCRKWSLIWCNLTENKECSVLHARLCTRVCRLQASPFSDFCCWSLKGNFILEFYIFKYSFAMKVGWFKLYIKPFGMSSVYLFINTW